MNFKDKLHYLLSFSLDIIVNSNSTVKRKRVFNLSLGNGFYASTSLSEHSFHNQVNLECNEKSIYEAFVNVQFVLEVSQLKQFESQALHIFTEFSIVL